MGRMELSKVEISRVGIGGVSSQTQGLVRFQAQGLMGFGTFSYLEMVSHLLSCKYHLYNLTYSHVL